MITWLNHEHKNIATFSKLEIEFSELQRKLYFSVLKMKTKTIFLTVIYVLDESILELKFNFQSENCASLAIDNYIFNFFSGT